MEKKDILTRIKKVEIKTHHLVEGLLQGSYKSAFKGQGIEFSQVREYFAGDDVRVMDWKVTSRMNHPYIKEFIEERDLTIYILFDVSGSNEFGFIKSKKDTAIDLVASLMFAALKNNDEIGLCLFTNKIEKYIKPKKGRLHIFKLIDNLINFKPKNKTTNLNEALKFISRVVKKKSIIFIISDFFSQDFKKYLSILKNRHDIIAINMNDIRENNIPDVGYIELEDTETNDKILVNTSDKSFREQYVRLSKQRNEKLKSLFNKFSIDTINIKTNENFEIPLRKFFKLRERRIMR